MGELIQLNKKVPAALQQVIGNEINDDLSSGIKGSYGVVSIRGGSWKIKFGGDEAPLLNDDGDAMPGFEVVLVKASPNISKVFYDEAWVEGSDLEPACSSNDGITPDAEVSNPQCATCAACSQNVWGSRITDNGKKAKACADSRRVAIAPANDIANEVMDGLMLLRIPAASLKDLSIFGKAVAQKGLPYCAIITRLSFDPDAAYPKLRYKAVRALSEDEGVMVAEHLANEDGIANVLGLGAAPGTSKPVPKKVEEPVNTAVDADFEVPLGTTTPETVVAEELDEAPKTTVKKKAAAKKKAVVKKKAEEAAGSGESVPADDLDAILGDLDL